MKLGKILKNLIIWGFLGAFLGMMVAFLCGIACTEQCTAVKNVLFGTGSILVSIGERVASMENIANGIYGLIVGGILGAVFGIFKSFIPKKENNISDYADYSVNRKELEKSVSEMKRKIDGTVTQYNNMFDGESYYCQKEKTSIDEAMKKYQEKLGELDAAVQKFNETNMEDKGHGNV